ncbi:MAG: DUF4373 domain-containing protein [Deltaproteobacteria bacterium]|nr:DUF4373 domain-containing protein [Deltaproteobacteria bacterium]
MSRPRKQTIDYFPHHCQHGRILFILEKHFSNDGYAVFYKLLEQLGASEGHFLDFNQPDKWEYFTAITLLDEDIVTNILNKMSDIGVIDRELWQEKIVWAQFFVDDLEDVYSRRKIQKPDKPGLMSTKTPFNGNNDDINPTDANNNPVTCNINPQSKVKESKEKKIKKEKNKNPAEFVFELPDWIPDETWVQFEAMRKKIKKPLTPYASHLIVLELKKIQTLHNHDPVDVINQSIKNSWQGVFPLKNGFTGNSNGGQGPQPSPFTICPRCKREVLKSDLEGKGCLKCQHMDHDEDVPESVAEFFDTG